MACLKEEENIENVDKLDQPPSDTKPDTNTRVSCVSSFIHSFVQSMRKRSKQICFILAISITTLAALHNGSVYQLFTSFQSYVLFF